jgi:hypothetical protein
MDVAMLITESDANEALWLPSTYEIIQHLVGGDHALLN